MERSGTYKNLPNNFDRGSSQCFGFIKCGSRPAPNFCRSVDPLSLFAEPDPALHLNVDSDPAAF